MKAKFFLCCLVTALIFTSAQTFAAHADTGDTISKTYARADAYDIYLCREMDAGTEMFAIPYTYCVQILDTYGEWYKVRYAADDGLYTAIEGFCLSEHLTVVDKLPEKIYLNLPVKVTLKADSINGSVPVLSDEVTAAFYGVRYIDGYPYSYVYYKNDFNYIFGEQEYEKNEIPQEQPQTNSEGGGKSNAKVITAVALTALAVVALVILYLTGRSKRYV